MNKVSNDEINLASNDLDKAEEKVTLSQNNSFINLLDNERKIIQYISEQGQASRKDIELLLYINNKAAVRLLGKLLKSNLLETSGGSKNIIYLIKK